MVTAQTIIEGAWTKVGVRVFGAAQWAEGLSGLNTLLDTWSNEKLLIVSMVSENFPLVASQREYTIGSSGDFDTARPIKIVSAYIRSSDGFDSTVTVFSKKEYDELPNKTNEGEPGKLAYVNEFPLGKIYFNSTPTTTDSLYIDSWKPFAEFAAKEDNVVFPPGYKALMEYNLAVELGSNNDRNIPKNVFFKAAETKNNIMAVNSTPIRLAKFDSALVRGWGGRFDSELNYIP